MQHLDEGTIHSWLDGALSAEEAARVSAHVEECPQCAAAVAEARGFIAASSRILTALDNVPRGVVPVGERAKPRNWAAWRAAAAVLVVALGSFAVLRERMGTHRSMSEVATVTARGPVTDMAADSPSAATVPSATLPANDMPTAKVLTKPATPVRTANPLAFGKIDNRATPSQEKASAAPVVSPSAAVADVRPEALADKVAPQNFGAAPMKASPEPLSGQVAGVASSVHVAGAAMSGIPAGPTSIRVVGTPRVIGEKRTLYELAPGDTVLLAEVLNVQLNSVVVTALGTTRVVQSADTSGGRQIRLRGASSRPAASDSQRSNAAPNPVAAPPVPATAPPPAVEILNGITTLTWTDPASGNTMKLSGRHSAAELTEIRRRIEQLRPAEAAKKKP
jgi:anti-sigma factor RsiW